MSDLQILVPLKSGQSEVSSIFKLSPSKPFSADVLAFIQALSQRLLKDPNSKAIPELVALGFWLRPANIKQHRVVDSSNTVTKALGTVLHFTPSNVDSMFVYSWVCSLLMGNNNIVRVASAESEAKTKLLSVLNHVMDLDEFASIAKHNIFVSYPKESDFTHVLSKQANARVIWGGDDSVQAIRHVPSHPRCRDISFADRYSACLINGDALQKNADVMALSKLLWRDTEPHGQQACSSPRLIFWLGDTQQQLALFEQVNELAKINDVPINQANNHLVLSQLMQSTGLTSGTILQDVVCVLPISEFNQKCLDWHTGAGAYFVLNPNTDNSIEQSVESLASVVTDKLQTLSVWKVPKPALLKLIESPSIQGIDRIVPVGQALDFEPTWDGYDLFNQLSRKAHINV